jgi:glycosyltransferase involved in cell wall biosynthesis
MKIRLSQVMIVKNEEKNIEQALSWASGIAFEQIIVDTGSTDRTVELAKQMGAKVFHFKWIDDFAAAKNYAIEQAKGDWIAFLDADEFFSPEDAKTLMDILKNIEADPKKRETCLGISAPWVNIDDDGRPMTIASQARIFRNDPSVRYVGRIHESLSIEDKRFINADNISIIHTGYSQSAHMETGKSQRNIDLLRKDLKSKPNDISLRAYLANALSTSTDEANQAEAAQLFSEVIKYKKPIFAIHKIQAYMFFINDYSRIPGRLSDAEDMCRKALNEFPGAMDFEYLLAVVLSQKGDNSAAWDLLKSCEANLINNNLHDESIMIPADPTVLFSRMIIVANSLGDVENVILYSTHVLTMDKTRQAILGPCIATLLRFGVTDAETIELLSNIYDMNDPADVMFIKETAKKFGAAAFAERLGKVRLSQCMIVKNEEKNIERALGWAKDISFEQIVVDTGSTDRTVELAEKMGAKVYHFKWIDDFSAAKNYAMDQAKGDWIAILDADEYMLPEDAAELMKLLEKIQNDPVSERDCDAITCRFVDIDDKGNTAAVGSHQRIFRNRPYLRFVGKIHEAVTVKKKSINASDISIIHTGYTKSAYKDTKKTERNISMLREEHKRDPDNPDILHYLANSISSLGTSEALLEAEEMHLKALASKKPAKTLNKELAFDFLIPRYIETDSTTGDTTGNNRKDEAMKLCNQAIADLPDNIDYRYYRAVLNNQQGNYKAAADDLNECEKTLINADKLPVSYILVPSPLPMYYQMYVSAEGAGEKHALERTRQIISTILNESINQTEIVGPYIRAMSWYGATDEDVLAKLSDVYDRSNPKDMMFIARAAKDGGAIEFSRNVISSVKDMLDGGA